MYWKEIWQGKVVILTMTTLRGNATIAQLLLEEGSK